MPVKIEQRASRPPLRPSEAVLVILLNPNDGRFVNEDGEVRSGRSENSSKGSDMPLRQAVNDGCLLRGPDGWRRRAPVADRGLGRLTWAGSGLLAIHCFR